MDAKTAAFLRLLKKFAIEGRVARARDLEQVASLRSVEVVEDLASSWGLSQEYRCALSEGLARCHPVDWQVAVPLILSMADECRQQRKLAALMRRRNRPVPVGVRRHRVPHPSGAFLYQTHDFSVFRKGAILGLFIRDGAEIVQLVDHRRRRFVLTLPPAWRTLSHVWCEFNRHLWLLARHSETEEYGVVEVQRGAFTMLRCLPNGYEVAGLMVVDGCLSAVCYRQGEVRLVSLGDRVNEGDLNRQARGARNFRVIATYGSASRCYAWTIGADCLELHQLLGPVSARGRQLP